MRFQWKRLAIAACLSLACAGGTLLWYYGTEKKILNNGEAALAQVSRVGDEVLRRPATRLLWQQVNTGDNLYNGETLRTSAQGELRIQFEDGRYIDLEPDSLIVLQKSKGEISLDLLEGSLFVNAQSAAPAAGAPKVDGLVLNSKNGKVDLTGASANLSKGSGDSLDLRVLEGSAKIKGADGKEKSIESGKGSSIGASSVQFDSSLISILSPIANKPYFVDPEAEKPVLFKWKGFPESWKVSVLVGPTRKELKDVGTAGSNSEVQTKLPLGKYWWKLVARDATTNKVVSETPITRMDLQGRAPPAVIFPEADAEIQMPTQPYNLTFKWLPSDDMIRFQLEVSSDPLFKTLISNKTFSKGDSYTIPALKEGEYHWRMSAFYEGSEKPITGKAQKFTLVEEAKKEIAPIAWNVPAEKLTQSYIQSPQLELWWEPRGRKDEISSYKVNLQSEDDAGAAPLHFDAKEASAKAHLAKPGRYIASIEAVDKNGIVVGKSEPLKVATSELPLLKAPSLLPAEGLLKSGFDGKTQLTWGQVQGAKEYWLTINDQNGKQLAHKKYDTTTANLRNLMPGEYNVKIEVMDTYGRPGQEGVIRRLLVPDSSGLKAPSLKKVKVN